MPYLALIIFLVSNSMAQLSDILFKDCNISKVKSLETRERAELVQIIRNLFTSQPTPVVNQNSLQGLLLYSLGDRALQCVKQIIPDLAPESYILLPNIIEIINDDTQSFDTQDSFQQLLRQLTPIHYLPSHIIDTLIDQLETKGSLPALILKPLSPLPHLIKGFYRNQGTSTLKLINQIDPLCGNRTLDLEKPKSKNLELFTDCPTLRPLEYFVSLTYDPSFSIRYKASELLAGYPLPPELLFQLITLANEDVWQFILKESVCGSSLAVGNYLLTKSTQDLAPEILERFICLATSEDLLFLEKLIFNKRTPDHIKESAFKRYLVVGNKQYHRFVPVVANLSDEVAAMLYEKTGDRRLRTKALNFMRTSSYGDFSKLTESLSRSEIVQELGKKTKYKFINNLSKLRFPQLFAPLLSSESAVVILSKFKSELLPILTRENNPFANLYRTINGNICLEPPSELSCNLLREISALCTKSPIRESLLKKQKHCLDYDTIETFHPFSVQELVLLDSASFLPVKGIGLEKRRKLFKVGLIDLPLSHKLRVLESITDIENFTDLAPDVFNAEQDESVKISLLPYLLTPDIQFLVDKIKSNPKLLPCLSPQVQSQGVIKLMRDGDLDLALIENLGRLVSPTSELKVALVDYYNISKDLSLRYRLAASLYYLFPELRDDLASEYRFHRFSHEFQELLEKEKITCNRNKAV